MLQVHVHWFGITAKCVSVGLVIMLYSQPHPLICMYVSPTHLFVYVCIVSPAHLFMYV